MTEIKSKFFKFIFIPIVVVVVGGYILNIILQNDNPNNKSKINVKGNVNVGGDLVQGNKINIFPENKDEKRILVSPEKFSMVAGLNQKFIMKITNNRDIPLYAVNIFFKIENGDFLTDDINIESVDKPSIDSEFGDKDGKIILSFDGMIIHGLSKRNGEMANIVMEMVIDNISANSTKDYKVFINGAQRRENSLLKLEIKRSSEDPVPVHEGKIPIGPEDAFYQKGNSLRERGKYKEAIEAYNEAYKINPKSFRVINNWGITLSHMGLYDQAIKKFEEAILLSPSSYFPYQNLGTAYFDKHDFHKAIEQFQKAIAIDSKKSESYFACARAYEKIKMYDEAITMYTKFIELNSNASRIQKAKKSIENLRNK